MISLLAICQSGYAMNAMNDSYFPGFYDEDDATTYESNSNEESTDKHEKSSSSSSSSSSNSCLKLSSNNKFAGIVIRAVLDAMVGLKIAPLKNFGLKITQDGSKSHFEENTFYFDESYYAQDSTQLKSLAIDLLKKHHEEINKKTNEIYKSDYTEFSRRKMIQEVYYTVCSYFPCSCCCSVKIVGKSEDKPCLKENYIVIDEIYGTLEKAYELNIYMHDLMAQYAAVSLCESDKWKNSCALLIDKDCCKKDRAGNILSLVKEMVCRLWLYDGGWKTHIINYPSLRMLSQVIGNLNKKGYAIQYTEDGMKTATFYLLLLGKVVAQEKISIRNEELDALVGLSLITEMNKSSASESTLSSSSSSSSTSSTSSLSFPSSASSSSISAPMTSNSTSSLSSSSSSSQTSSGINVATILATTMAINSASSTKQ